MTIICGLSWVSLEISLPLVVDVMFVLPGNIAVLTLQRLFKEVPEEADSLTGS